MAVQNLQLMEFYQEPTFKPDILRQVPYINGGQPQNAIRPIENLRNRYYASAAAYPYTVPNQAMTIARTNPPVPASTSPVTLDASGMGATYRLSDEALRQYALGTYLHNMGMTYYQTRP